MKKDKAMTDEDQSKGNNTLTQSDDGNEANHSKGNGSIRQYRFRIAVGNLKFKTYSTNRPDSQ